MERLLQHVQRFVELNSEEQELLLSCMRYEEVSKKTYLLKQGKICTGRYFVIKGLLRQYIVGENDAEQITHFALENWWIADYDSLERRQPSEFCIQAVELTELLVLDKEKEDELFRQVPKMERYFRLVLQRSYAASMMRIKYIFTTSGEERYNHFNSLFPEFIQRIPQYMLASYLGFSAEFLSKIRAKRS
ncbi:Crp/Fnr family transcriptional regulator [[Flexibacter] sp. ATCC 35208]|uniref:Crp/Fnr family transcriptional regulator n=1 Tax=[Flexibacter] sp. ATCC 35208 TaxID=1936242 RepID=UPI0009D366AC|nr:Crp/Fnr family transcriptional regulator [[Flexibacter] sp. ATCC 35208]OMP80845.1 cyclic nucleotide-binding protein [[Flexibacter] sp. ATCC 35208]